MHANSIYKKSPSRQILPANSMYSLKAIQCTNCLDNTVCTVAKPPRPWLFKKKLHANSIHKKSPSRQILHANSIYSLKAIQCTNCLDNIVFTVAKPPRPWLSKKFCTQIQIKLKIPQSQILCLFFWLSLPFGCHPIK